MFRERRAKRRAKKFLKAIGATDLLIINPQAQMFWASVCARAAWKSFTTNYMIVPVAIEDEHMDSITRQEWLALKYPANSFGFYPDDDGEAFRLAFNTVPPKELIADPEVQTVLTKAYDLLEKCEDEVWDLPQPVTSAAHKLRTAINRQVQANLGGD